MQFILTNNGYGCSYCYSLREQLSGPFMASCDRAWVNSDWSHYSECREFIQMFCMGEEL